MAQVSSAQALALHVVRRLQAAGHAAYLAGGCVRDRIMGRDPQDYDVATAALPPQVLQLFPRSQKVGMAFGVMLVREKGCQVEVATFRADSAYSDGRHPDAVRFTTAEEDARRRDFTCNGLFFDPIAGELHDYVGGRRDIEAKILRAIGQPRDRFAEDHLRMLRAVRFASRLDFAIESDTRAALAEAQEKIGGISRERIGEEIRMMLEHPARTRALQLLAGFDKLFTAIFGFAPPATPDSWPIVSGLPAQASRAVALAALTLDCGAPDLQTAAALLRERLMLSNDETAALTFIAEKLPLLEKWEDLTKAAFKRMIADPLWPAVEMLYRADPQNAEQLLAFSERTTSLLEEGAAPAPLVTGADLIRLGLSPGPAFKHLLDQLYDRQLEGEFTDAEDALQAAKMLIAKSS